MDIGGEKALCCVKVLCGTFDLPAKAEVCNFTGGLVVPCARRKAL